jgi:hypothetical protein
MSAVAPILLQAIVDDAERPALVAASQQLEECLNAATPSRRHIRLEFASAFAAIQTRAPTTVIVASLLPEVARDEPLSSIEARWRSQLSVLTTEPAPSVFLCTVFRHVARNTPAPSSNGGESEIRERIRRLNLFALELSHDTGIGIIDIDRALAHIGARQLGADYRLASPIAAEVAAHTIVGSILSAGLDDTVAPEVLHGAAQFQGALWQIGTLLQRRLGQR